MHWAAAYVGQPWELGQSDCWHFCRRVWREKFGLEVPAVIGATATPLEGRRALRDADLTGWAAVGDPREGDAVMMSKGQTPCHVGLWVSPAGGSVLHSVEGIGAICTPVGRLAGLGYRVVGYYRRG